MGPTLDPFRCPGNPAWLPPVPPSVNEARQLLSQPLEHAALGKQHGVQRQVQRLRDLHSRLAFRDVTTERLPRDRGEIALPLYPLDRLRQDVLVMLAVPQAAQGAVGR